MSFTRFTMHRNEEYNKPGHFVTLWKSKSIKFVGHKYTPDLSKLT